MRKRSNPFQDHSPMNKTLLVLLGPTGVGKSDVAFELAVRLKCEIISADSRQIYREMRIGTAVPSDCQLDTVKHHFVRTKSVEDYYSASIYEREVLALLPSLFSRDNIALMAGGSGMYIDAVCNGIDDIPDVDPEIRQKYLSLYREEGINGLRLALRLLDPDHYARVDPGNPRRIIRALEISETTGRPYSSFLLQQKRERQFSIIKIGLDRRRDDLYKRINQRVDEMIDSGLEQEARSLLCYRDLNALRSVGYSEFFDFFDGSISRDKAIELIKRNSRRYAKRQLTWWRRDRDITWFDPERKQEIFDFTGKLSGQGL
jgi:tRNA dimethylallyltransferase